MLYAIYYRNTRRITPPIEKEKAEALMKRLEPCLQHLSVEEVKG